MMKSITVIQLILLQLLSLAAGQDVTSTPEKKPAIKMSLPCPRSSVSQEQIEEILEVTRGIQRDVASLSQCRNDTSAGPKTCSETTAESSSLQSKLDSCQKRNDLLQSFVGDKLSDLEQKLRDAAKNGNVEEIKKLIDLGVNPSAADSSGYTPLHWATTPEAVTALLDAGADVNAVDKYKWTPLHWAAYYDNVDIARTLLDRGASTTMKGYQGRTPQEVAQHYNKPNVLKLLSSA